MFDKIKKTFRQGLQLMIPLFLAIFVIQKVFEVIVDFLKPIIEILPESPYFGDEFLDLRALIAFIILIFLCGIVMRLGLGKLIADKINYLVMRIVPGHSVFEKMINEESESDGKSNSVVFANIDEAWAMGLIIEEKNAEGYITVFVPSAPIPAGGNLYMMREVQIKRTSISVQDALKFVWHLGKDSDKILSGKMKW